MTTDEYDIDDESIPHDLHSRRSVLKTGAFAGLPYLATRGDGERFPPSRTAHASNPSENRKTNAPKTVDESQIVSSGPSAVNC
ncbi:hypothetical protein [Halomarina pelagica]|uniref:hypothetical protein n=1 Tax=Halomarina pelagica TaxID=2961599 RepID=UPI0020C497B5|nr:hypothetical protein [Halomarina sp. BND7]